MSTLIQTESSQPFTGLGTWTITLPAAGSYVLACEATSLPPGSGMQMVLSQTGSASNSVTIGGSSTNPAQNQPSMGTSAIFECAASDVLSVVLSSANAVDSLPNAIKGTITLYRRGA